MNYIHAQHNTYKYVGECIYCGSIDDLHNEHCIPESLNGVMILEKGSCEACGRITSRFEGDYARQSLLAVRTVWNMKSKRPKKRRPTEFPIRLTKGGENQTVNVPLDESFPLIPMLEVGPPGVYPNRPHKLGLRNGQYQIHPFKIRDDEHLQKLAEKYEADDVSVDFQIDVSGFLRMIAKIAYCISVWRFGLKNIGERYVVPAILGTNNDIWNWVGSDGEQEVYRHTKKMLSDHDVNGWFDWDGVIHARVKLFKKSLTPEYEVVVGKLTDVAHGFYQSIGRI